jgi:hypothetical protein
MVNHPSFERETLKVPREKEICHEGQILLKILDRMHNQEKGSDGR